MSGGRQSLAAVGAAHGHAVVQVLQVLCCCLLHPVGPHPLLASPPLPV